MKPSPDLPQIVVFTLILVALALWGLSKAPNIAEPLRRTLVEASLAGQ